jgi:hypothetical protein
MDGRRSGHPDAGSVFDKIAECRERIERIENDAAPSTVVEREAQDVEDRIPERQEGEEQARDDAHGWRD